MSIVTVERKVLEKNDEIAGRNRIRFAEQGLFVVNLVSSPGSGKTSILERTLQHIHGRIGIAVIEGDVQTDLDARRVSAFGIPVVQIVTHGACHLEAKLVQDALEQMDLKNVQLLIIENVGNLVCPANYDLGESMKIIIASTTEGDDKPLKYPGMFRNASVMIINKIDLLPYVDCDISLLKNNALHVNPSLTFFETSCTTKKGIPEWCSWLEEQVTKRRGGG